MLDGKVTSIAKDKGFGFISPSDGGPDVFFHITTVAADFALIKPGESVRYELEETAKKPRASKVERMSSGGQRGRSHSRSNRGSQASAPARPRRPTELGYVTKLRKQQKLGFISPDGGGPELLFGFEDVKGQKTATQLALGDSVRFVREPTADEAGPPMATSVEYSERYRKQSGPELPENPRARRRKPTWRK